MVQRSRRGSASLIFAAALAAACGGTIDPGSGAGDAAPGDAAADASAAVDLRSGPPPDLAVDLARPPDLVRVPDLIPGCPGSTPRDCSPGNGTGNSDQCYDIPSCFYIRVRNAVTGCIQDHPTWFDQSSGQPLVLQIESYMNDVVARVNAAGLCAIRDPNAGDEIAVKHDNAFAENFDILTATNYARWGAGIYTGRCAPAWF